MKDGKGFTLIEIMIVLAIIGGVIALSMPYINNRNTQTKGFLRRITVLSRELHTRAKLQGAVYRLVLDLGTPGDGSKTETQKYWVERSNGKAVLKPDEEQEAMDNAAKGDQAEKDPRGFAPDTSLIKEPTEIPSPLRIDRVELSRLKEPIVEGKAYIHYLPEGLADEAAIHIKGQKDQAWTISIAPLTGKAELISKTVSLREMKSQ
jgi:prepilin-type N-terminal cleavage/methylation domain-containing protein